MQQKFRLGIMLTLLGGLSVPVFAGDPHLDKLDARLSQLEQAVHDLQDSIQQQGASIAEKMAAVDQIRSDWNGYQGTVDAISQQQQLLLDQLRKYIDEFDGRLRAVEGKGKHADATDSADGETTVATAAPAVDLQTTYQDGLNAIQARNYPAAITSFQQVTNKQPGGKLALDAQFWLGECRYALKQYTQAIKDYQIVIDKAPGSDKAMNALYKQGEAKLAMGLADEGKRLLQQVVTKAPNSKIAQRANNHLNALTTVNASDRAGR